MFISKAAVEEAGKKPARRLLTLGEQLLWCAPSVWLLTCGPRQSTSWSTARVAR